MHCLVIVFIVLYRCALSCNCVYCVVQMCTVVIVFIVLYRCALCCNCVYCVVQMHIVWIML